MAIQHQVSFIRGQVARFIELCSAQIDQAFNDAKKSKISLLYFESSLEEISEMFFQSPERFSSDCLKYKMFFDSHVFEHLSEITRMMQGASEMYPFPKQYIDAAGDLCDHIADAETEYMKQEIQHGVALKIQTLLREINQADSKEPNIASEFDQHPAQDTLRGKKARQFNAKIFSLSKPLASLPEVCQLAIQLHPQFKALLESQGDQEHLVFQACLKDPHLFYLADESLKEDVTFVKRLVSALKEKCPVILHYAACNVKDHFPTAWLALHKTPEAYYQLSPRMQENRDILIYITKYHLHMTKNFPKHVLENQELMQFLIKINPLLDFFLKSNLNSR